MWTCRQAKQASMFSLFSLCYQEECQKNTGRGIWNTSYDSAQKRKHEKQKMKHVKMKKKSNENQE